MSRVVSAPGPCRALMLGVACVLATAPAARADQLPLVVFGDSFADVGNVSQSTGGAVPPSPYSAGRYSNGPVWVEQLAAKMGLPALKPSLAGGTDYAFGGAETGSGTSTVGTPNLGSQINTYLGANAPKPGQLFVLAAGMNDFMLGGQTNPGVVVDNVAKAIKALAAAGADRFLVPNLPPLGQMPLFANTSFSSSLNTLADNYNSLLDQKLDALEGELGVTINRLDTDALFRKIMANPQDYGFTNVTAPAYDATTGTVKSDPNSYLFWDTVHPTSAGHQAIADAAFAQAPEPATLLSLGLGLGLAAGWRRWRAARAA